MPSDDISSLRLLSIVALSYFSKPDMPILPSDVLFLLVKMRRLVVVTAAQHLLARWS